MKENKWKKMNRRMNERMRERMRERMNVKMNERMNEWMNEWKNKWMKEEMKEIMNYKKKAWFVWIVDLKLSKKLKGKQEKKDGVAKLWIWIYIEKKMGVRQSCVFEW